MSAFDNFFENNLIDRCIDESFNDLNCLLGTIEISFSLVIALFILLGLIKMLKYYKKMNFETSLILCSLIQIILLDIIIIVPHDFLFELFFFVQIFHLSLTIRKFIILVKTSQSKYVENLIFIILNIMNIGIFTIYILSLMEIYLIEIYIYIQCSIRVYYFILAIILTILCRCLISKLIKMEHKDLYNLNEKELNISTPYSGDILNNSDNNSEWTYVLIREKQITPLYILNLICSFLQMSFIFIKHFLLKDYFAKDEYEFVLVSYEPEGYIIYYIYLIICFLNLFVNYICFYFLINEQYNPTKSDKKKNRGNNEMILTQNIIERETLRNEEEQKNLEIIFGDNKEKTESTKEDDLDKNLLDLNKGNSSMITGNEKDFENMEIKKHISDNDIERSTLNLKYNINRNTSNNISAVDDFENI